ncbi:5'/3'-nucleotidase SurE, partial [Enterobacter kobei]|nr:5'/3'-nucleotidase SurE [Enterobacter kobei]
MQLKQAQNGFYYVNGTPTDCIHIGQSVFSDFQADFVFSGINRGANMGDDTLYSGTVAAATEAYLMGIPAVAFSLNDASGRYWATAEQALWTLLAHFFKTPPQFPILWNINIPAVEPEDVRGIKIARLGRRHHGQNVIPARN